ncbi:MAG: PTS mannose transporter subunit IIAB [Faecalicoccus sp.]|uniref:PTS sugar transporter subunit IIA n=1 Tax=Faecalicoccus TaxID=1573536 RepID=UPI002330FB14|nr:MULTISPECIES: PTS mannose transporter subunit IIAB [Faecalicoccus]MCI6379653.1 PTS mannose transporter subunit IIAB [Erysipelotrichaceae bacterium]MDB7988692.1 PTS mannose transporter subunit IIAB [Faecalicoccus pleomorphus]MDB7992956.1 PTS mannose transporter subunit IIAB [Faecalicoccus pleomorphus]MDY4869506.1 PTS mannose transporter subunit IIAB [Faecalicoccus sp.]
MAVSILIMTHGHAGEALVESSKMIIGDNVKVKTLSLLPGMSTEDLMNQAKEFIQNQETTLFMVDLYGGTPSNVAMALTGVFNAKCVSGLNLGMLMETLMVKEANSDISLDELQQVALKAGHEAVKVYDYSNLGG